MISIKSPREIEAMRRAGRITAQARALAGSMVAPGVTTHEIDTAVRRFIESHGAKPSFLGYGGYPGSACISVNDEVVHGIGTPDRILLDTDIVSIDVGIELDGGIGDTALTFGFGELTPDLKRLLHGTKEALMAGIKQAKRGNCIRDISQAVESTAKKHRLGVVREYVGHGCGVKLHEPPEVPNFVGFGRGALLVPGMVICIEPMLNLGTHKVTTDSHDHWTVRTRDGACAAHFEHMVLITENESEILTWPKTT